MMQLLHSDQHRSKQLQGIALHMLRVHHFMQGSGVVVYEDVRKKLTPYRYLLNCIMEAYDVSLVSCPSPYLTPVVVL